MTVKVNLSKGNTRALTMATLPVTAGLPDASEELTAGSSAATSTIAATSAYQIWEITPDVDIWVAFGAVPDPTAAGARRFLVAGIPRNFGAAAAGEKVAVLAA